MKNTKKEVPFLKPIMILYNGTIIILNGWIVYKVINNQYNYPINFLCNDNKNDQDMIYVHYIGYILKFIELLDTEFFILRRSFRQITFLGIYHHVSIIFIGWCSNVFDTYGDFTLVMALNGVIHVIMYTYYLLSLFGIKCWWKIYLTRLQMIQFCIVIVQFTLGIIVNCGVLWLKLLQVLYMSSLLFLFSNFYTKAYKYNNIIMNRKDKKRD